MQKIDITQEKFEKIKVFHWGLEFDEIFSLNKTNEEKGFDIVIGNPPYIKARDTKGDDIRELLEKNGMYKSLYKMWDMYIPFIERGLKLLKQDGIFTMIIPDTIGVADYSKKIVDIIINDYSMYQIDFYPKVKIFVGVGIYNKILFIKNNKEEIRCKRIVHEKNIQNERILDECNNKKEEIFKLKISNIDFNFEDVTLLENIFYVSYGLRLNSDKDDPNSFKKSDLLSEEQDTIHNKIYTEGKLIDRYRINKKLYVEWGTERCPSRLVRPTFPELYAPTKILMSREKRVSTISTEGIVCDNTIIVGVPYYELKNIKNKSISKYLKNLNLNREIVEDISLKFNIKYVLAILNSKLIAYFLKFNNRSNSDSYPDDWKKIPIKNISSDEQTQFIQLVDKMFLLQQHLSEITDNMDERKNIEEEIKKIDKELDQNVNNLYGLGETEINVIKNGLKN